MDQRQIVVDEVDEEVLWHGKRAPGMVVRRRARSRFVIPPASPEEGLRLPEIGDPWCPLTVRARLERTAEAYRALPKPGPRRNPKSGMPETVREMWKDAAKEEARDDDLRDSDLNAAHQIVDILAAPERAIAWAIAHKWNDSRLGRKLGVSHHTAAVRKLEVLYELTRHWNTLALRPDREDVLRARKFIHKDFD
jgi:hypothetical protein